MRAKQQKGGFRGTQGTPLDPPLQSVVGTQGSSFYGCSLLLPFTCYLIVVVYTYYSVYLCVYVGSYLIVVVYTYYSVYLCVYVGSYLIVVVYTYYSVYLCVYVGSYLIVVVYTYYSVYLCVYVGSLLIVFLVPRICWLFKCTYVNTTRTHFIFQHRSGQKCCMFTTAVVRQIYVVCSHLKMVSLWSKTFHDCTNCTLSCPSPPPPPPPLSSLLSPLSSLLSLCLPSPPLSPSQHLRSLDIKDYDSVVPEKAMKFALVRADGGNCTFKVSYRTSVLI